MMKPKIIECEQGSQEWLALRRTKITATDSGVILGLNPWKTPLQLFEEKLGLRELQPVNDKMREGSLMEEEARDFLNQMGDTNYKPIVLESVDLPFMMASLDGMNSVGDIVEIKCGRRSYENAEKGEVEPYYFSQCQKQMYVANCDSILYFTYRNKEEHCSIRIHRDDTFIEKMIEAEKQFYKCMMDFTPPPACDRDFVHKGDKGWYKHATLWRQAKRDLKLLEAREECLREELINMCDGQSSQGAGVRISHTTQKGRVNLANIPELKNVDLEKYRGKNVSSWRFTEVKSEDE